MGEREVIGKWADGSDIYENPTEDEILAHYDELKALMSQEQREVMKTMRHAKILSFYYGMVKGKPPEEAIRIAIQTWNEQYPWEVKPFLNDIRLMRESMTNVSGFSNDKDKSMLLIGRMPAKIKEMLIRYDINFFERDKNGRSKNLMKFYSIFTAGRIGGAK